MGTSLKAEAHLCVGAVPGSRLREPKVAETDILIGPLPLAIAPLRPESLLGSLKAIKPRGRFFQQAITLEQSGAETRKSSGAYQMG